MTKQHAPRYDGRSEQPQVGAKRILRFTIAGVLATASHYAVMFTGLQLADHPVIWSFVGAAFGSLVGYLINYFVTFKSTVPHGLALFRYFLIVALSIALNTLTIFCLLTFTTMSVLSAQLLSTFIVFVANYFAHSNITFRV